MTGREIFRATLEFDNPPRIAMGLPGPYPNDMIWTGLAMPADEPLTPVGNELRRWRDPWGVVWASLTRHDKGEVMAAAIEDWSDLDSYTPPDLGRPELYAKAREAFAADAEHFRVFSIGGFTFNIARKIRKLENYLCDLLLERERVDRLHELVRTELLKAIDGAAEVGADAIMFPEDWGTQDRLMVSPEMWREIFRPEFEVLAGRAREKGLHVLMHSCGKITEIIPDLIECGISALQFDQFRLHGIDTLAERFAGKVSFWGPVDIQRTLQTRDPERIRGEARELVEKLGQGGGFIAGYYWDNDSIGLTPDVQDIACQAFVEYGTFQKV